MKFLKTLQLTPALPGRAHPGTSLHGRVSQANGARGARRLVNTEGLDDSALRQLEDVLSVQWVQPSLREDSV